VATGRQADQGDGAELGVRARQRVHEIVLSGASLRGVLTVPMESTGRPIYLDYSATTPVDPRVVEAMVPWLYERYGNPASGTHAYGWEAQAAGEQAREQVAALIGADRREIVWTSGATESNNLALK